MGKKRKEALPLEQLHATVSRMLVAEHILKDFDIYDARESKSRRVIEMRGKEGRNRKGRVARNITSKGYCSTKRVHKVRSTPGLLIHTMDSISIAFIYLIFLRLIRMNYKFLYEL
jgi:hypothetical protein